MAESTLDTTIQQLTHDPGVYRMLDEHGTLLYVGKARDLKKRVSQYFQKNLTHPKTIALIQRIQSIEVTITRTEAEALLLESNLIKTFQPKYNILLRDDKTYPYILIDTSHTFPSMSLYRSKHKPKKGKVFGPFPNTSAVYETLNALQKCFKIRNCRDTTFASRTRPCLQYQIKRCSAPCTALIDQEGYARSIQHVIEFLSSKSNLLLEQLTHEMEKASRQFAFEQAAIIRDQIQQLRLIQQSQSMMHGDQDIDIIAITFSPTPAIEHVKVRNGNILSNQAYFPRLPSVTAVDSPEEQWLAIFDAFFRFYYIDNPDAIPSRILTQPYLNQSSLPTYEVALKQLSQRACHIQTRPRGAAKGWMDFAMNNLDLHIKQHLSHLDKMGQRLESLKQRLNLSSIERLECFDISHIQGHATIASCVVFNSFGPEKAAYRQFNIKNLKPGDDYAALDEAITRRFKRLILENQPQPDILLIDGGKGQVNIARAILEQLGLHQIKLLGITKGEGRKASFDRIYDAQSETFLPLAPEDEGLHFLQYLRDEAHRFAITAHRKKRGKEQLQSSLECIEGIGPKRRKALLTYFGGLQGLVKASLLEIMKVPGISPELAKRIFEHVSDQ